MKQYQVKENQITITVKKSPLFTRIILFGLTFLFFVIPPTAMIFSLSQGSRFHIGYFIGIGLCGLIVFYLLRMSLWNTFGSECISIEHQQVTYEANYRWFRDGKKSTGILPLIFSAKTAGYKEDYKGVLVIGAGDGQIECVAKLPLDQLDELIAQLNSTFKIH